MTSRPRKGEPQFWSVNHSARLVRHKQGCWFHWVTTGKEKKEREEPKISAERQIRPCLLPGKRWRKHDKCSKRYCKINWKNNYWTITTWDCIFFHWFLGLSDGDWTKKPRSHSVCLCCPRISLHNFDVNSGCNDSIKNGKGKPDEEILVLSLAIQSGWVSHIIIR